MPAWLCWYVLVEWHFTVQLRGGMSLACGLEHPAHIAVGLQAYAGFIAQHVVTDTTPLGNLSAHLADPWSASHTSEQSSQQPLGISNHL